jgi:hypothetical protein
MGMRKGSGRTGDRFATASRFAAEAILNFTYSALKKSTQRSYEFTIFIKVLTL